MLCQQRDIPSACAKRRQRHGNDRQAVIEVLAEFAFLDELSKIGVGGRDHADIHFQRLRVAESLELTLLKRSQQLDLR